MSTTIVDLVDLWGPAWKLEKERASSGKDQGYYYAIGTGAIGAWGQSGESSPVTEYDDEALCHFVGSRARLEHEIKPLTALTTSKLIIGATQAGKLEENISCRVPRYECFPGKDLRSHGTTLASTYNASTTLMFSAGYSGTQIGVSKQYQRRPPTTRKQILLEKWTLAPDKRNPSTLLLWCGLEVSLCTRNARRRRLIEVLGSETMSPYIERLQWEDPECAKAFKKALGQDIHAFVDLYIWRREWRKELGLAVAQLLDILASTGIASTGDLEALTIADSLDPDQILTLSPKKHTWISMLKDTAFAATFAVTTSVCLSFPYSWLGCSGQVCRGRRRPAGQHTVLETALAPVYSYGGPNSKTWSHRIPSGKKLPLQSSGTEMLKVVDYLPQNELLVTWSRSEFVKRALLKMQLYTTDTQFCERIDGSRYELLTSVGLFVISEKHNDLPCVPRQTQLLPDAQNGWHSHSSDNYQNIYEVASQAQDSSQNSQFESSNATMESDPPVPSTSPSTVDDSLPHTTQPSSSRDLNRIPEYKATYGAAHKRARLFKPIADAGYTSMNDCTPVPWANEVSQPTMNGEYWSESGQEDQVELVDHNFGRQVSKGKEKRKLPHLDEDGVCYAANGREYKAYA